MAFRNRGGGARKGSGVGARRGGRKPVRSGTKIDKDIKLCYAGQEWALTNNRVRIGRAKACDISIQDGLVSNFHAILSGCFLYDSNSTNGTELNGKRIKSDARVRIKAGDRVQVGDSVLRVESGKPAVDELSRSKVFPNSSEFEKFNKKKKKNGKGQGQGKGGDDTDCKSGANDDSNDSDDDSAREKEKEEEEKKMSVKELMDKEFAKIIGHENIKQQLKMFYKKVQLDKIRRNNGKLSEKKALYHMMFLGPPGTGKTTMANLVAKVMLKMQLVKSDKVVFVNNALDLLAGYSGQTPAKVDAKVEEAKGGVLFIDEAYSIVKEKNQKDSFGKEAIETLMKHLDPPSCVFIFAGYEKEMEAFLRVNDGLNRRIPYRYVFDSYSCTQLIDILKVMCQAKGESVDDDTFVSVTKLLETEITTAQRESQNAGMINNWLSFAQIERDDRVDIEEAIKNPEIASILVLEDFVKGLDKVKQSA